MWPSADSFNEHISAVEQSLSERRLEGMTDVQGAPTNGSDQDSFLIATRTQLVWGENALLCGNFDEASRTFLRVIVSFEEQQQVDIKDRSSTMSSGTTASSLSVPLDRCRVHGQPTSTPTVAQQEQQPQQPQDPQQQEQRQRRRQQQVVTLLGSALYGLGTTYMLQGYFDHAQPALQQAVHLYWRLYGEGSPLLELARTQLHRLYCYWDMVQQEQQIQQLQQRQQQQQQQQSPWLMPGAYQLPSSPLHQQQQQPVDELSLTEHYRRNVQEVDDEEETEDEVDVFDDEDYDNYDDDIAMFPDEFEFDEETDELDEHHACYCPGEICRMFSRSVRHAAAA